MSDRRDAPDRQEASGLRGQLFRAFRTVVVPLLGVALLVLAAWILRRELRAHPLSDIAEHLLAIPPLSLLAAVGLTVLGYTVLTGYDALALRYAGVSLPYRRIALSSFVAYVFSHNVGLSIFGGGAIRYRMLSGWGVKTDDIARVIAFTALTFWLGFLLLGGVVHTAAPIPLAPLSLPFGLSLPAVSSRPFGVVLLAATAAYGLFALLRREPIRIRGFETRLPSPRLTAGQLALSSLDWLLAAAVFYAVLPAAPGLTFPTLVAVYLLAQVVGIVSSVPGGLGVFEGAAILLLKPWLESDAVLAAVLTYRVIYYLLPLAVGIAVFAVYELRQRRDLLDRARLDTASARLQSWAAEVVPRLLAVTTFLAGGMMLLSGATPELPERLAWLRRALPVPLIELSKLTGSIVGAGLLLLANALRRRLDAAYLATLGLLGAGAVAALGKGLDWEEASVLLGMALLLLPCRSFFIRRSSLLSQPLSRSWWLALAAVAVGAAVCLDLAYRHVAYSSELWWRFGNAAQAPRSLRAMLAAAVTLAGFGAVRLLRPAPPAPDPPTAEELDRAQEITSRSRRTTGYLALLRDKELLFHDSGRGFLMYGVSGRTWVAMGDPVGPPLEREELAWRLREAADRHGARAVFYSVGDDNLPIYLDLGLELIKLGEEGRVPLAGFSLAGGARKGLRQAQSRMVREGGSFEIVPAAGVPPLLDELEAISDAWLAAKNTREKRFSLGFFDRDYLARLPVALVRRDGRPVAFANVWPSEAKGSLTIDLMRYTDDAPPGVMEYLFAELMLWGSAEGYEYFSMGMAPLSGLEEHRFAPLWNRFGALLFRHGEHFYNFQGLRQFKAKFDPEWAPRYLASPSTLATPVVLTRVAGLIAGGVTGVLSK